MNKLFMREAWGIHERDHEDDNLLGNNCTTLICLPKFRKNIGPATSETSVNALLATCLLGLPDLPDPLPFNFPT